MRHTGCIAGLRGEAIRGLVVDCAITCPYCLPAITNFSFTAFEGCKYLQVSRVHRSCVNDYNNISYTGHVERKTLV